MNQAKKTAPKAWTRLLPAAVLLGMALLLQFREAGTPKLLVPFDHLTAGATAACLKLTGLPVQRQAAVLSHPGGFSYEIYYRCTGLILVLFLSAALLALPGGWRKKIKND